MPNPPQRCVFCGKGNMSKEHVWSDWIKILIPPQSNHYDIRSHVFYEEGKKQEFPHTRIEKQGGMHKRKVRKVCQTCNNGWMGRIVEGAKPFATALILDETIELDAVAQQLLSSWIALSVIMGEYLNNSTVIVKQEDRAALFKTQKPPSNWVICLGRCAASCNATEWFPLYRHHCYGVAWDSSLPEFDKASAIPPNNFQMTTYAIRALLVQAFSCDIAIAVCLAPDRVPDGLVRIWPPQSPLIRWPCTLPLGNERLTVLSKRLSCTFEGMRL
jgi:hypothetical protein